MKIEELSDAIGQALTFALASLHTITVCRVAAVNEKTINCRPVINREFEGEEKPLPIFEEVPMIFLNGGASYQAMPITVGDYCLLLISERCFDNWYDGNDSVLPPAMRMHDYSDGFALVGIQNKAGAITIPDVITQIGDAYYQGNHVHAGDLERTGNETVTGKREQTGDIDLTGNQTISGTLDAGGAATVGETLDVTGATTVGGALGVTGAITSAVSVSAPLISGVITGPAGAPPVIPQPVTALELHADDGYTGVVTYLKDIAGTTGTITFVDGICTVAT